MHFTLTKKYLGNLQKIIEDKNSEAAKKLLEGLHAADIAEIYDKLNIPEAKFLYMLLEGEKAADVLAELEDDDRERFMSALPSEVIARKFIDFMDSDDAADVIADLPENKQEEVLKHISDLDLDQAGDIVDLLSYEEDTAGGLMRKEYISVKIDDKVEKAIEEIRLRSAEVDDIYYVYVTDEDNILKGTISLKRLLLSKPNTIVKDINNKEVIYVKVDTDDEKVASIADKYDLVALPVIDSIGRLEGIITIDDLVDVIKEEADKDYQMISGISEDVEHSDKIWLQTRARLPWLLIGLIGGVFGSQVIGLFEENLAKHAAMAFFIPMITAMGGNVGVQSSSIVVQGIANNTIGLNSIFKRIMKEISVALINAVVCSSIILIYNLLFTDSLALTLSVSVALFMVIITASILGTFIPLTLNRFKIDPAVATGPFITTINDILGLAIYLTTGGILYNFF